jgi:hypothetical protein
LRGSATHAAEARPATVSDPQPSAIDEFAPMQPPAQRIYPCLIEQAAFGDAYERGTSPANLLAAAAQRRAAMTMGNSPAA